MFASLPYSLSSIGLHVILVGCPLRLRGEPLVLARRNAVVVVGTQLAIARLVTISVNLALLIARLSNRAGRTCGVAVRARGRSVAPRVVANLASGTTNACFAGAG